MAERQKSFYRASGAAGALIMAALITGVWAYFYPFEVWDTVFGLAVMALVQIVIAYKNA